MLLNCNLQVSVFHFQHSNNSTHVKGVLFGLSACRALLMNPAVNNCWRNIHNYCCSYTDSFTVDLYISPPLGWFRMTRGLYNLLLMSEIPILDFFPKKIGIWLQVPESTHVTASWGGAGSTEALEWSVWLRCWLWSDSVPYQFLHLGKLLTGKSWSILHIFSTVLSGTEVPLLTAVTHPAVEPSPAFPLSLSTLSASFLKSPPCKLSNPAPHLRFCFQRRIQTKTVTHWRFQYTDCFNNLAH